MPVSYFVEHIFCLRKPSVSYHWARDQRPPERAQRAYSLLTPRIYPSSADTHAARMGTQATVWGGGVSNYTRTRLRLRRPLPEAARVLVSSRCAFLLNDPSKSIVRTSITIDTVVW